jgi:hypothetical protein
MLSQLQFSNIITILVTTDAFWINARIYLFDTAGEYTLQYTVTHIQSRLHQSVLGNGFKRRAFPFLWVPELFSSSATSFSQQQLTTTH